MSEQDHSRAIPEFNLAVFLASQPKEAQGSIAPFIPLQFPEMKTAKSTPWMEYPKCITLPNGEGCVVESRASEDAIFAAYAEAERKANPSGKAPQSAAAAGGGSAASGGSASASGK